jgi:probable phosphoglycerate mutase
VALDVYLARHGETAWSRGGRHTGRTDLPLLPEGEAQARRLGEHVRGLRFKAVYSSDLQRAVRTAELAGFARPQVTRLLREFDYGDYEGRTSAEIWKSRPGWQLFVDGCPGGETPAQVATRARAFLDGLRGLEGAAIVFSHGHLLRALGAMWLELDIAVAAVLALDTASVSVLRDDERGRALQRWNWTDALVGDRPVRGA